MIKKNYNIRRVGDQLSKFYFDHKNYKDLTIEKEKFEFNNMETLNSCIYYFEDCGSAQSSYASFFNKKRVITNLDFINITHQIDFFFQNRPPFI